MEVSLSWPAVTIRNINAVCSAFFKQLWTAPAFSACMPNSSLAAITDPAKVITHLTISDVTSKQQQSCRRSARRVSAVQRQTSRITGAVHCFAAGH